jgi:hypothetical protein
MSRTCGGSVTGAEGSAPVLEEHGLADGAEVTPT